MISCPCGSEVDAATCCDSIIAGATAATAVALMRSRYTAYVRGAIDYLIETHDPSTRGTVDREGIARWSRQTAWSGLTIVDTVDGGVNDATGIVEFIARGATRGLPFAQRERSRFRRLDGQGVPVAVDGKWHYVDGDVGREPARTVSKAKLGANVGRNDPCPCGSGVKYKRCHGA